MLKDDQKDEKPLTAALVAARAFAAERVRVIGDILRADAQVSVSVLRAGAADLQNGTKRNHQVYYFLGQLAARHEELALAALQFQEAVRRARRAGRAWKGRRAMRMPRSSTYCAAPASQSRWRGSVGRDSAIRVRFAPVYFNFHLAGALAELGEAEAALEAADKAIEQTGESDRLTVRLQKFHVLRLLSQWDDAIALGKQAARRVRRAGRSAPHPLCAGQCLLGREEARPKPRPMLRAILDIDPDHAGAANDLGFHLADQGRNLDEAERLVRRAIAADRIDRKKAGNAEPENAAYIDSLGWVLFRRANCRRREWNWNAPRRCTLGATDPVVWDHLGDVLFRLGEKAEGQGGVGEGRGLYESEPRGPRGPPRRAARGIEAEAEARAVAPADLAQRRRSNPPPILNSSGLLDRGSRKWQVTVTTRTWPAQGRRGRQARQALQQAEPGHHHRRQGTAAATRTRTSSSATPSTRPARSRCPRTTSRGPSSAAPARSRAATSRRSSTRATAPAASPSWSKC